MDKNGYRLPIQNDVTNCPPAILDNMLSTLIAVLAFQAPNTLTADETKAGWKLLFDGKSLSGWKNYKSDNIRPGWQVVDGNLKVEDPRNAGDLLTKDQYDWFELTLEFNLGKGSNSGVMYHVSEKGAYSWFSGPEIQLYDHKPEPGAQTTGFLYELYESKVDASKPGGEWNKLRVVISPKLCWTEVNGVKYYEYVLGSEDFKARVAKSKFANMPEFGKMGKGHIALQGDHGQVSFRNIKIKPLKG